MDLWEVKDLDLHGQPLLLCLRFRSLFCLKQSFIETLLINTSKRVGVDSEVYVGVCCFQVADCVLHGPLAVDHPVLEVVTDGHWAGLNQAWEDVLNEGEVFA